jgi:hypothetical protein
MSVVIDAAEKVHNKQVEVATRSQEVVAAALRKVADVAQDLRGKAPQVPESVSGPVEKVTAPVTKVVGTPSELAAYVARSTQDWLEVQHKLQRDLVAVVAGAGKRAEGVAASEA